MIFVRLGRYVTCYVVSICLLVTFISIVVPQVTQLASLNLGNFLAIKAVITRSPEASNRSQQIFSKLFTSKVAFQAYRSETRLALLEARFADAKKYGDLALALAPFDWQTHDLVGRTYWSLGDKDTARQIWQKMDQIRPRLSFLGHVSWQSFAQRDYATGVAYFEQGIDYDPTWIEGYWALSSYYWQEGQTEKAAPYLFKLAQLLPKNEAQYLFISGRISLLEGKLNKAGEQFCQAWQQAPDPMYWHGCLWVLWHQGTLDQGWSIMTQAVDTHPEQTALTAIEWGDNLFTTGNYLQAARFYKIACQIKGFGDEICLKQTQTEQLVKHSD